MSKNKIEKLEVKIKKLKVERLRCKKNQEHHNRKKRQAVESSDFKKYEKHNTKEQFWLEKISMVDSEIRAIEIETTNEELRMQETIYKEKLRIFDSVMVKKLSVLHDRLQLLAEKLELQDITGLANEIYNYYVNSSRPFKREDLIPYHQLGMLSVRIRATNITEEFVAMQRITSTRSSSVAAQKRSNVTVWSQQLASQITDCLKVIQGRYSSSWLRNIKKKLLSFPVL